MTMNFEQVQLHDGNPEPRCPCVLLLDTSGSMLGKPILELNAGLALGHSARLGNEPLSRLAYRFSTASTAC